MPRTASISRDTAETKIKLSFNLDGTGQHNIATGVGFFDHMLTLFTRHGLFDLDLQVDGDLHVDFHHTVEDTGIALGQALKQAVGDKKGINRYGHFTLPMEETMVTTAVDLSGRAWYIDKYAFNAPKIGDFDTELVFTFWQAFSANALMNLHHLLHYGNNNHHISEALFKSTARAIKMAITNDPRETGVPSSKGVL